jgi:hypothetical protein
LAEAEPRLPKAHEILVVAFGPNDPPTKQFAARIVTLYEASGKPDQAAKYRAVAPK